MKFYGNANLQQNLLQNAVLETLSTFPQQPVAGQIAFVNRIVYICVNAGSLPVWVPLTNEITAYTHVQNSAALTWTVTHMLNTSSVNVQVFDGTSSMVMPASIDIVDPNSVSIQFAVPTAGRAMVLTGHFDGNVKPTYAYTHYQTTASFAWVIQHNLGYNPIVRIFIGNQEVQPASVVHDSTNQVTVSFNTSQAGYARLI